MVSRGAMALLVVTAGCLGACDSASPDAPVEISDSGACGDAFFWAFSEDSGTAVTVDTEVRDRSTSRPTTVSFTIPSTDVKVEILDLEDPNFCDDLGPPPPPPTRGRQPVAGSGVITVGPAVDSPQACGQVEGKLTLTGLEAADGTVFEPISFTSDDIGCYAG